MRISRLGSAFVPIVTVAGFVFLYAPIIVLIVFSFNGASSAVVWKGFSSDWYSEALSDQRLMRALRTSSLVAAISAVISTTIGTSAAYVVIKRDFRGKTFFSTLMVAPLVLPEIVLAVGILLMATRLGITLGYSTLVAGHVLVSVTFSFLIVRAAGSSLDPSLDDAAADLGAKALRTFRRITLPLLAPAVLSSLLLSTIISFNNFVISTFVSGVGSTPLPIEIFSRLRSGLTPEINALGTVLIGVNVALISVVVGRYIQALNKPAPT